LIEAINIYETNINDGYTDSILDQLYIDCEAFLESGKPISCYDVLSRILTVFGARIWLHENKWWIVPVTLIGGQFYYRQFTYGASNYTYSTGGTTNNYITIGNARTAAASRNVFLNRSAYKEIDRAVKKIIINQELGKRDNIIKNGDLEIFSGNTPRELTPGSAYSGVIHNSLYTNNENTLLWSTGISFNINDSLLWVKKFDTVLSTLGLKISLKYFVNAYIPVNILWSLRINGTGGSYYLKDDGTWSSTVILYNTYTEENTKGFQNMTLTIDCEESVPDVGDYCYITFQVFRPTAAGTIGVYFDEFKIELTNLFINYPEDNQYTYEVNSDNMRDIELDVYLGDLITQAASTIIWENSQYMYDNTFYYKSGVEYIPTSEWHTQDASENQSLLKILLNNITSVYNYNTWKISGEIQGFLNPGILVKDSDDRWFIINDYSHNLKKGTFDVTLLQVKQATAAYLLHEDEDIIEFEDGDYVEIE